MAKGQTGNTASRVWEMAEPIARELGLRIWDVRFLKEGASWFLRVFIDKDEGVSIVDCENMSRALDKPLDEADLIEQSYCLEVSSPGLERELVRDAHFLQYIDAPVQLRLIRPLNNKRDYKGVLEGYENGMVTVRFPDGEGICINKKEMAFIKLDDFDNE